MKLRKSNNNPKLTSKERKAYNKISNQDRSIIAKTFRRVKHVARITY